MIADAVIQKALEKERLSKILSDDDPMKEILLVEAKEEKKIVLRLWWNSLSQNIKEWYQRDKQFVTSFYSEILTEEV